ncbi:glycosyltransferase family 2 protein [Hymenobacter bucti]|uniref:Glycosyltransferase family 2 protein n=1 Tax=Hymenobacter bucti TaxID=1844114 RepID=A0ABW4QRM4_9BACT
MPSKVSVILPNYNHARFLPQRIESILTQSFADFELLLLDDCSPDNSREIIKQYAAQDARIQTVFNEKNSGSTFKQWNKGIALAKGEYVWLAESDDFAAPDFLETLLARLESDEEIVLAYANSVDIDENGTVTEGTWEEFLTELDPMWTHDFVTDGLALVRRFMAYRNIIPNASAVLIRASALRAIGPAPEDYRVTGDWLMWARLLAHGKVAYVSRPLNYFRSHRNTARSKNYENGLSIEEASRVLQIIHSYGDTDPTSRQKAIALLLEIWYQATMYHRVPWSRHKAIYRNLVAVDPQFRRMITSTFGRKFFKNASGLRILLGDRLIYPLLGRKKPGAL